MLQQLAPPWRCTTTHERIRRSLHRRAAHEHPGDHGDQDENDFFFTFAESELRIQVPARYYSKVLDGFRVKMGLRPMDLYVGGPESKGNPERVAVFENLGDERRIGVRVGEHMMMLITNDETRYRHGDIIRLEVNGEKTHLFDLETGDRIRSDR